MILHYIGPGKRETGDWCFSDGFISFIEIMNLYMTNSHFRGRELIIISDCSHSSSWVEEAMKLMDEQGVGNKFMSISTEQGQWTDVIVEKLTSCHESQTATSKSSLVSLKSRESQGKLLIKFEVPHHLNDMLPATIKNSRIRIQLTSQVSKQFFLKLI